MDVIQRIHSERTNYVNRTLEEPTTVYLPRSEAKELKQLVRDPEHAIGLRIVEVPGEGVIECSGSPQSIHYLQSTHSHFLPWYDRIDGPLGNLSEEEAATIHVIQVGMRLEPEIAEVVRAAFLAGSDWQKRRYYS
jgi:hypothetical protein